MDITTALSMTLRELSQPVITEYDLYVRILHIIQHRKYRNEDIKIPFREPSPKNIRDKVIQSLCDVGTIAGRKEFPAGSVYEIVGNKPCDVGDVVCSVDPFAYVSHLSAMEFHGLTNRMPKILFISTPAPSEWKAFAIERMRRDIANLQEDAVRFRFPRLKRIAFDKVMGTRINRYASIHQGAFKNIEGRKLRVSTIGRTFLDMLRNPEYCGGMRHIMDVWREHAATYSRLIVDDLDRHGAGIEKARAGYILEEICGIRNPKLDEWAMHVQRGGSRKLDPHQPYKETYSEKWCISLNVE